MNKVAIFGATSLIAQEYCRIVAARGEALFLVGRDESKLQALARDLQIRGAKSVAFRVADFNELGCHTALMDEAERTLGEVDQALVAYGVMPDQKCAERDFLIVEATILTNFTSVASLCERIARKFEAQRRGTLVVIGSVAGDRGRASGYIYGSTKAALDVYLSGLRNRLYAFGVRVVTIKPGLVDTPMTAHLPKTRLFASAERVARGIDRAIRGGRSTAYVPWIWRWIMLVIRLIPEPIFIRMTL